MAIYERSTVVDAPLDRVWAFHSNVDGLRALTPDWMGLRIESVRGPDGEPDPALLEAGSELQLSVRPFGIGPRRAWQTRIVDRRREGNVALFRDVMLEGPFERWAHTHRFRRLDTGTQLVDRVEYELGRPLSRLSGLARPFFEPLFRIRHARAKARLEQPRDDDSRPE